MTYRKYTKREKLAAVMAAEMGGVVQAEKVTGIRESTIRYWIDQPEFAEFRAKTREDLHDEVKLVAHLAWKRIAEALRSGEMEPRDAIFAAEKSSTLMQLLKGEATSRTEHRIWTDDLDDDEKQRLRDWIDSLDDPASVAEQRETAGDTSAAGTG